MINNDTIDDQGSVESLCDLKHLKYKMINN